ncbi:MAG: 1,4-alpha-glucan branching protein GlgB [Candidatus Omnitrophica bacterium]|nr:1,4-alpha-glucan branching protein GlgB [Candidatus Omnitrophota bacterium]
MTQEKTQNRLERGRLSANPESGSESRKTGAPRYGVPFITDHDIYLFKEGNMFRAYEKLGAHPMVVDGIKGTFFAVWAPNAERVSVIGNFNGWDPGRHGLAARWDHSGIWEGFLPGVKHGDLYKYHIVSPQARFETDKGDPYAFFWETAPNTASIVWDLSYDWQDRDWMESRKEKNSLDAPWAVYEVHLGSWKRVPEEGNRFLTYREIAPELADYVNEMGYTHVELLPVMEYPFYGSWGYQPLGYFAATSRFGTPQDFMYLVDYLHQKGIGVILDWVPSHFPSDAYGLYKFDGTFLYEHADPRQGFHPDWKSAIFNYGRNEVRDFLISSAVFWLDKYHIDGLRVDGVASMLYLDYSRGEGEWIPNRFGGRENIEAIALLKRFNETVYADFPDVQTMAEESTAWPMVTRPTYLGGLGFGMKWNMGWMHDTLEYISKDPIHRKHHHDNLTFSLWYAFTENFMLPLSHDEVVHGKGALLRKMPGDAWQKFANLRLLTGVMYAHPGKKLLFMGAELGQWDEWDHNKSLDWHLLQYAPHRGVQRWIKELNRLYRREPALWSIDFSPDGFAWMDCHNWEQSVVSFVRKTGNPGETIFVICNFTPVPRHNYRVGVPRPGRWKELINSDAKEYGGSGHGNFGGADTVPIPSHGEFDSITVTVPPLGIILLKHGGS